MNNKWDKKARGDVMVGPKEAGTALSEQGVVTVETVIF